MRQRHEETLQISVFRYFRYKYPQLAGHFFAIPNGGSRHHLEAFRLKMQGVTAGVSDTFLALPRGGKCGLWMEMKVGKNNLTDEQKIFRDRMLEAGYGFAVIRSMDEFEKTVATYLAENQ